MTAVSFSEDQLADMAATYFANNTVAPADIPVVLRGFMTGSQPEPEVVETPAPPPVLTPAVTVKKSVRKDALVCLECGAELNTLKRHLQAKHNLAVDEYKAKWGLPKDYPTTAPAYSEKRSAMAKEIGFGRR